jgi:hypothetical protein
MLMAFSMTAFAEGVTFPLEEPYEVTVYVCTGDSAYSLEETALYKWMEEQTNVKLKVEYSTNLTENTEKLKNIISFWHSYRDIFRNSDVSPIGEKPSGRSFTGFRIKNRDSEYALLLREVTFSDNGVYVMPNDIKNAEVLLSNADVSLQYVGNALSATFSKPRAYAFIKLN